MPRHPGLWDCCHAATRDASNPLPPERPRPLALRTRAEAGNLVFMSSLAMNGEGRGIVIRTGDNTMIGKIATLASDTNTHRSTLQVPGGWGRGEGVAAGAF